MSNPRALRFRFLVGWLLPGFSLLLLFLIACWLLSHADTQDQAIVEANAGAALLGMDVYCVKNPFVILVDTDFPRTDKFLFAEVGQPLSMSVGQIKDVDGNDVQRTRKATMSLESDFSIGCTYSIIDRVLHVHELELSKKEETLVDLNADGTFDLRQPCDLRKTNAEQIPEIWYKGKWRQVVRTGFQGRHGRDGRKLLGSGETVFFDMRSGLWQPTSSRPQDRDRKGDRLMQSEHNSGGQFPGDNSRDSIHNY